jgi:hypothetical protein
MTMSQPTRGYLYRIALALLPILVAVGLITIEMSGLVAGLLVAVFAVAEPHLIMAAKNTPTKRFVGETDGSERGFMGPSN